MNITVTQAARICGGQLIGEKNRDREIGRVVIDSRAVEPGDLFVAYKGERVDGHDFIGTALEKGAACCLAERLPEGIAAGVILVSDVQKALEQLCAAYRESLSLPVVGIRQRGQDHGQGNGLVGTEPEAERAENRGQPE